MKEFIILADSSENPNKKKWYEFWKKKISEEVLENERFKITIKYGVLTGRETRPVIFSDLMQKEEDDFRDINQRILLKVLPKIAKSKGLKDVRNSSIAYINNKLDLFFLIELAKMCKKIVIFSDKRNEFIVNEIFAQTGLIIEVLDSKVEEKKFDFIIDFNGKISDSDKKEYDIDIEYNIGINLPVKLNHLRLTKWLIKTDYIELNECNIKISKKKNADECVLTPNL